MNRYEFALKIARTLNLPKNLIEKTNIKEMKKWMARRPRDSSLDTSKAKNILKTEFYNTDHAMKMFREE
ncbi:sugar nucleotide-binding protein [Staphylothermus hellenicus]|uniref:sugar nucleotide-binding protein n=1 Tax=Staphylothermus hellenicus TaxID=84599 RepID=UPI0001C473AE